MFMLAVTDVSVAPILALGAVLITALRMRGWLSDELLKELQEPFSRTTLTLLALLAGRVSHLCWRESRL